MGPEARGYYRRWYTLSDPTKQDLQQMQSDHLRFLESTFGKVTVAGVPVMRALTYKTIQIINNVGLKEILEEGQNDERTSNA